MKIWPAWFRLGCLLPLLVLLTSCQSSPTMPLKLGTNLWPGYEPLYLAREHGLLLADQVVLVELLSASEVMRAFRNGAIDAAALTLDEVITLRSMGMAPVIVQVADISAGADAILARQGIHSIADLRGKRIGVEATALGAYMLSRALEMHQLASQDVEVVRLEVNEHRAAFLRGDIDAVVTFDPVRHQLMEAGAVNIFDSSQIPGEIVDVLVVREELLGSHHAQVQHLIQAWQQSLELIRRQPERSARDMARRLKMTPDEVLHSQSEMQLPGWESSRELMRLPQSPLQQQAEKLATNMHQHRLIDLIPDLEGLVYSRYPDA